MRIAYFGLPLGALLLEHDGHDLVLVALCRDDALGMRRAKRHFADRLLIKPPAGSRALAAHMRAAAPDLLVSWFWTTRLPPELVALCPLGGFGVHPSLLPRHRGPDPYYAAIVSGDDETGVTAHRIAAAYDTGAMLGQKRLHIDPSWDAWQLARALDRPSLALLRETAARFAEGRPPHDEPQDDAAATEAPAPADDDLPLRFAQPTERVLRQVRALAPAPGASAELAGEIVTITRASRSAYVPASLDPGEAMVREGRALVRTGDGAIELIAGEGEDGRALDAAAFVALIEASRG